jgi:hypothetical protein
MSTTHTGATLVSEVEPRSEDQRSRELRACRGAVTTVRSPRCRCSAEEHSVRLAGAAGPGTRVQPQFHSCAIHHQGTCHESVSIPTWHQAVSDVLWLTVTEARDEQRDQDSNWNGVHRQDVQLSIPRDRQPERRCVTGECPAYDPSRQPALVRNSLVIH